jgi:hypothetical protein
MTVLSIKEILAGPKISNWKNCEKTRDMVAEQIKEIYGESELKNYDPNKSALPYSRWVSLGYRPKKNSKALKSITIIEEKDSKGKVTRTYCKKINLFYYRAVELIPNQND